MAQMQDSVNVTHAEVATSPVAGGVRGLVAARRGICICIGIGIGICTCIGGVVPRLHAGGAGGGAGTPEHGGAPAARRGASGSE